MNSILESIPIQRYIAIDLHKKYVMVGGQNKRKEWVLRPRKVRMSRFRDWAAKNLKAGDAVVIEATCNTWDIYDVVAPLVSPKRSLPILAKCAKLLNLALRPTRRTSSACSLCSSLILFPNFGYHPCVCANCVLWFPSAGVSPSKSLCPKTACTVSFRVLISTHLKAKSWLTKTCPGGSNRSSQS